MKLVQTSRGSLLASDQVYDDIMRARRECAAACSDAVTRLRALLDHEDPDICLKAAALLLRYGGVPEVKAIELSISPDKSPSVRVVENLPTQNLLAALDQESH